MKGREGRKAGRKGGREGGRKDSDVEISVECVDEDMMLLMKGKNGCFHFCPHRLISNYL